MNTPNKITLLRILLIPIFIILLYIKVRYMEYVAAFVFIILALTDALDGYLARKTNQVTKLGQLIDPLADKLLVSAALIFLIGHGVPEWMAFIIIAREFAVTGLRLAASSKRVIIPSSRFGKIKTISQIVAIVAVIINFPYNWYFMLAALILTIISGLDYFIKGKKFFLGSRRANKRPKKSKNWYRKLDRQQQYYTKTVDIRAIIFNPLIKFLAFLRISPFVVTYSGPLFMVLFIIFIRKHAFLSLLFVFLGSITDLIDGNLARYQKRDNDRGKFADMVSDNVTFTLFIIGLAYGGLINGLIALVYVYFMILSKLFRVVFNSPYLKSDWHFKAVAGLLPNLFVGISYILFLPWFFAGKNYFNISSLAFSLVLVIDSFIFYNRVMKS